MTEDEARTWVADRFPDRVDLVGRIVDRVVAENANQNLIAASSLAEIWARHVVDSAQLVSLADARTAWVDIGTGGGFPGLIVAALVDHPVIMVEPRARRSEFLASVVENEILSTATVVKGKAAALTLDVAGTVSARAVASIAALFEMCSGFTDRSTRFLLPRGRSGMTELADARRTWQGVFHVEQSITDPQSIIVIAEQVRRR